MKSLKKFSKTIIQNLTDQLVHFQQQQDSEVLHEIRVNIKRMKAVLNATQFCEKEFKAHHAFLPYRDIFRKAGTIRESEVAQKLLSQYIKSNATETPGITTTKTFTDEVPVFLKNIIQRWMKDERFISKVSNKDLNTYLDYLTTKVKKELSSNLKMERLHKTRKSIKEILYLSKVIHGLSKKAIAFYSKMEELIGQWHDKQILLSKRGSANGGNKSELDHLKSASRKDKQDIIQLAGSYY